MKIVGIIAEYNPFHNGHAYQIQKIRKETGADYIAIAMSGDFVQRGAPALTDKYTRAEMALRCGADIVFELPVLWACSSAEYFARAGVLLFEKTGCIDALCFGAETDNLPLLAALAEFLSAEPPAYRDALSSLLRSGLSFPAARAGALVNICTASETQIGGLISAESRRLLTGAGPKTLSDILESPNNILALEYLKALQYCGSSIRPYVIRRAGAGYHSAGLPAPAADEGAGKNRSAGRPGFDCPDIPASASGIRGMLLSGSAFSPDNCAGSFLAAAMPAPAAALLRKSLSAMPALTEDDFSAVLGYRLLQISADELAAVGDCTAEIANRIVKNRASFSSFTAFASACKSRDITLTRMNRILLHTVLSLTDSDYRTFSAAGRIPYLRILGFRRASAPVLSRIKERAFVPLISRLADAPALLDENARSLLAKDIFAAELYEQTRQLKALQDIGTPCTADTVFRTDSGPHAQRTAPVCKKTTPRSEYSREIVLV